MAQSFDMSQYLDLFLQEADEQLLILEQELVALERDPSADRMSIIFRAAHTLKGSSRAMGFSNFAEITHRLENILDALRNGRRQVSTPIADVLLASLDCLIRLKDSIADSGTDAGDYAAILANLDQTLASDCDNSEVANVEMTLPEEVAETLKSAAVEGAIYRAKFLLSESCVMKFARAFMAVSVVQENGELLCSLPDSTALEEEAFDREFELYFQSSLDSAALTAQFNRIGEIESFSVEVFEPNRGQAPKVAVAPTTDVSPNEAEPVSTKKTHASQTVRVEVSRLDELMNLVGELVIDRTRLSQIGATLAARLPMDETLTGLAETIGHLMRITMDLQDQLMKTRMLPIDTVFNRFPRMVRDLSQKIGKEVVLEVEGAETELDRSVVEVISDPLVHIIRNCVDHGIESPTDRIAVGKPSYGTVKLSARHDENHIVIEIIDDGRGIDVNAVKHKAIASGLITEDVASRLTDREALHLIFSSGLSTASHVTEVSGRGVGMDIVRANIQKLGGLIDVETESGKGSRFVLRLPLTLAIIRGLLIDLAGVRYVLPLASVVETLRVEPESIQLVNQREVIVLRGSTLPLLPLRSVFKPRQAVAVAESRERYVVVVGSAEQRVGLVVDSLVGEQEVVIKSLAKHCGEIHGISGATILGDGAVALIVDVNVLMQTRYNAA